MPDRLLDPDDVIEQARVALLEWYFSRWFGIKGTPIDETREALGAISLYRIARGKDLGVALPSGSEVTG